MLVNQSFLLLGITNLCCLHIQRGNPLLKSILSVPWEYEEIVPDYVMGRTTCALFLSLRYHNLNPDYINERLKQLGKQYELRVLLVQVCLATQRFYSPFPFPWCQSCVPLPWSDFCLKVSIGVELSTHCHKLKFLLWSLSHGHTLSLNSNSIMALSRLFPSNIN